MKMYKCTRTMPKNNTLNKTYKLLNYLLKYKHAIYISTRNIQHKSNVYTREYKFEYKLEKFNFRYKKM